MKLIRDLEEGERVVSFAHLRTLQVRQKKDGSPYLRLVLGDRTGRIEGRVWDSADQIFPQLQEGGFVKYRGRVETYNGARQLIVDQLRPVAWQDREAGFSERDLIPTTRYDIDAMWQELRAKVESETVRPAVRQALNNVLDRYADSVRTFPAGVEIHHEYYGGFLEHVLSLLGSVLFFADKYPDLDRDLLISGAILHDIGKLEELSGPLNPSYTAVGRLIGHVVIGRDIFREESKRIPDFPTELGMLIEHVILSHQGQLEWGSPKEPMIPEALLLHYVDDLDAKMNRMLRVIAEDDQPGSEFTRYDRYLNRFLYKRGKQALSSPEDDAEEEESGSGRRDKKAPELPF